MNAPAVPPFRLALGQGILLAGLIGLAGCADGADAPSPLAVGEYTSEIREDGRVLVRHGPIDEVPPVHILEPDLVLGHLDASEEEQFGRVAGLSVDENGRIHVLDAAAHNIRVFSPDGAWLRTLSRQGEGPGEIRSANALVHDADGLLWVHDPARRALMALDPEGVEVATAPTPVAGASIISRVMAGPDGRFREITRVADPTSTGSPTAGATEASGRMALVSSDPGGGPADTLFLSPITNLLFVVESGTNRLTVTVPEQPYFHGVLDPEGHLWTTPGHEDLGEFGLVQMTVSGDTLLQVEAAVERPRVDPDDHRELAASMESDAILRHLPDHGPTISRLVADDEGRIWVRRAAGRPPPIPEGDGGPARPIWDVFDGEGRWLGAVDAGRPLVDTTRPVRIVGGALYGVTRGEMDEEMVVRMPLPKLVPEG